MKHLYVFISIGLLGAIFFCTSFNQKEKSKSLFVNFVSCDSIQLEGLITYPEFSKNNKLIIEVLPCLVTSFVPNKNTNIPTLPKTLKEQLILNGYTYFEFSGRKDSIEIHNKKYPISTMYTKAQDLEAAIEYIKSQKDLKDKEIILLGFSEGGATSAIVAAKNPDIKALILVATPGDKGKKFIPYQSLCQDSIFVMTYGQVNEVPRLLDSLSSLDTPIKEVNHKTFARYRLENYKTLKDIAYRFNNSDSIAHYVYKYLQEKWEKEEESTRLHHKTFEHYCHIHQDYSFIQPEQVALKHWNPNLYFSKLTCPVLAIYGSLDRNLDYKSSLENIKNSMYTNNNRMFSSVVFYGYDHGIMPATNNYKSNYDSCFTKITEWILKIK